MIVNDTKSWGYGSVAKDMPYVHETRVQTMTLQNNS